MSPKRGPDPPGQLLATVGLGPRQANRRDQKAARIAAVIAGVPRTRIVLQLSATLSSRRLRWAAGAMPSTRRLTAILAADVVGYSRLMGVDEEGTHERLKTHHRQLIDPKIKEHRGRIVKNAGDGMLVEFASVVDAMRCAVEVQRGMISREPEAT